MTEVQIWSNPVYAAIGEAALENLPVLDVGTRNGPTDYIDYLTIADLTAPVMKGVDRFRRPFIAMKLSAVSDHVENEVYEFVGTFFQRYTDDEVNWAYGTCYKLNMLFHDSRVRLSHMEGLERRLFLLLNGTAVRSVDFYANTTDDEETDWVNGNGEYTMNLLREPGA